MSRLIPRISRAIQNLCNQDDIVDFIKQKVTIGNLGDGDITIEFDDDIYLLRYGDYFVEDLYGDYHIKDRDEFEGYFEVEEDQSWQK